MSKKSAMRACCYADDESLFPAAEEMYRAGLVISDEKPGEPPLIYARVTSRGVEKLA